MKQQVCVFRSIECCSSYINSCTNMWVTCITSARGSQVLLGLYSHFRQEIHSRGKRMCDHLICSTCDNLTARKTKITKILVLLFLKSQYSYHIISLLLLKEKYKAHSHSMLTQHTLRALEGTYSDVTCQRCQQALSHRPPGQGHHTWWQDLELGSLRHSTGTYLSQQPQGIQCPWCCLRTSLFL